MRTIPTTITFASVLASSMMFSSACCLASEEHKAEISAFKEEVKHNEPIFTYWISHDQKVLHVAVVHRDKGNLLFRPFSGKKPNVLGGLSMPEGSSHVFSEAIGPTTQTAWCHWREIEGVAKNGQHNITIFPIAIAPEDHRALKKGPVMSLLCRYIQLFADGTFLDSGYESKPVLPLGSLEEALVQTILRAHSEDGKPIDRIVPERPELKKD